MLPRFTAGAPNQLWFSDITEHRTAEGKLYLCAIEDAFSNRIVGYSIDSRVKSRLATRALHGAVARRGEVAGCMLHSDRGSQVTNRPIYVAVGVTCAGERDILGLWAGDGGNPIPDVVDTADAVAHRSRPKISVAVHARGVTVNTLFGRCTLSDQGDPDHPNALLWPSVFTDHYAAPSDCPLRDAAWRTVTLGRFERCRGPHRPTDLASRLPVRRSLRRRTTHRPPSDHSVKSPN